MNTSLGHYLASAAKADPTGNLAANRRLAYRLANQEFTNILIVKPSSLGDVVRCLPVLHALRRRCPQSRISWLIQPEFSPLLAHLAELDEIIEFDRRRYGKMIHSYRAASDFIAFLRRLHRRHFDMVLDLQGLFRSAFLSFCTAAPVRLGFSQAREFAPFFYTQTIAVPSEPEHIVESYWRFARLLAIDQMGIQYHLPIDPGARRAAEDLLAGRQVMPCDPYIVFLMGGTHPAKRWPPERFAELADRIAEQYDMPVVLLGAGCAEITLARQVANKARSRIIDLVGQTDLQQLMALLKTARLVVGNDSGPLHVAAALQAPLVGLYGPTDPAIVGPYGQIDGVVQVGADLVRKNRYSRNRCHRIENITVERVLQAVQEKLCKAPQPMPVNDNA